MRPPPSLSPPSKEQTLQGTLPAPLGLWCPPGFPGASLSLGTYSSGLGRSSHTCGQMALSHSLDQSV